MGRIGLLFLFMLATSYAGHAREFVTPDLSTKVTGSSNVLVLQINHQDLEGEVQSSQAIGRNEEICVLCEEFTAKALKYLAENKTQTEIIAILHKACSKLRFYKQQCIILVDYYAPLFFLEISSLQPEDFCRKVNLCEQIVSISEHLSKDSCGFCHHAVAEILLKLKDPDTQLEMIELLLKGCDAVEEYVKKCKRLVFAYGPLILVNAENFLETNDICTMLHACDSPAGSSKQELPMENTPTISITS